VALAEIGFDKFWPPEPLFCPVAVEAEITALIVLTDKFPINAVAIFNNKLHF
jgi:hypothetical protein